MPFVIKPCVQSDKRGLFLAAQELENALVLEGLVRGQVFNLLGGDPGTKGCEHLCTAEVLIDQDLAHAARW